MPRVSKRIRQSREASKIGVQRRKELASLRTSGVALNDDTDVSNSMGSSMNNDLPRTYYKKCEPTTESLPDVAPLPAKRQAVPPKKYGAYVLSNEVDMKLEPAAMTEKVNMVSDLSSQEYVDLAMTESEFAQPKRPVGRPRKAPPQLAKAEGQFGSFATQDSLVREVVNETVPAKGRRKCAVPQRHLE